eukprot:2844595-Amphidinium_carterae.1
MLSSQITFQFGILLIGVEWLLTFHATLYRMRWYGFKPLVPMYNLESLYSAMVGPGTVLMHFVLVMKKTEVEANGAGGSCLDWCQSQFLRMHSMFTQLIGQK